MASLLSEYDDLVRLSNQLNDTSCEPEFLRFVAAAAELKVMLANVEKECARLTNEIQKSNGITANLHHQLNVGIQMVDMEQRRRKIAETKVVELEKAVTEMKKLYSGNRDQLCAKVNDLLKEVSRKSKLISLDKSNKNDSVHDSRNCRYEVETVNETCDILTELGYSRSDNELETSLRLSMDEKATRRSKNAKNQSTSRCDNTSIQKKTSNFEESTFKENVPNETTTNECMVVTSTNEIDPSKTDKISPKPQLLKRRVPSESSLSLQETRVPPESSLSIQEPRKGNSDITISLNCSRSKSFTHMTRTYTRKLCSKVHLFGQRTIFKTESCCSCGKRLKFGKIAAKCGDCRATVHLECKEKLSLPCVPACSLTTQKSGVISDYAPSEPPMVPSILVHCVREIEARGSIHGLTGVYQELSEHREVKTLKEKFLKGDGVPVLRFVDTTVICAVVNDFLSSLNEPLVTPSLWQDFVRCFEELSAYEASLRSLLLQLPRANRDTMAFLILHLKKIVEHPEGNLSVVNLVKIFGPTVVGFSGPDVQILDKMRQREVQITLLEHMIKIPSQFWVSQINSPFHI